MRPVRLQVSGYSCFKDEVVVDFARLDRFVISGATGSGKTSLLDAMSFALFGEVPRAGKHVSDLISPGRDRVAVLFDFRIGDTEYRIERSRRKNGGATQVQLERRERDEYLPLAEQVRSVDPEVQKLLGLGYEAFKQAVILPQGEFAQFLKCKAAERRAMLNDLLRLQVYERMRGQAAVRERDHGQAKAERERRLNDDYLGVTPEAAAELARKHAGLKEEAQKVGAESAQLQAALQALRFDHEKTTELAAKQQQSANLDARSGQIAEAARRVEAAQRAAAVIPVLDQTEAVRKSLEARAEDLKRSEQGLAVLDTELERCQQVHTAAQGDARSLPGLREQIARLTDAVFKAEKRDGLAKQAADQQATQNQLTTQNQGLQKELARIEEAVERLEGERRQAEQALKAVEYDAETDQRLEGLRDRAARLQVDRARLESEAGELAALASGVESAAAVARAATRLLQEATQVKEQLDRKLEQAGHDLESAQDGHAAAHLRSGLAVGQDCPVCRQAVAEIPAEESVPELDQLKKQKTSVEKDLRKAAKEMEERTSVAAAAEATANAKQIQHREAAGRHQRLQEMVAGLDAEIKAAAGRPLAKLVPNQVETWVLAAADSAARKRHMQTLAEKRSMELAQKAELLVKDREARQRDAVRTAMLLAEVQTRLTQLRGEGDQIGREIQALTGGAEPRSERDRVQRDVERIAAAVDEAVRKLSAAEKCQAQLVGQVQQLRQGMEEASRLALDAEKAASEALRQAEFGDAAAARGAAMPRDEASRLRAEVDAQRQAVHALQARIVELLGALGDRRVSNEEMQRCQQQTNQAAQLLEAKQRELNVAGEQLRELEQKVQKAAKLRQEQQEHHAQHAIYHRLAEDLQSDHFQAYRLEETLAELVRGASLQLGRLTDDRYGLDFIEDDILVIDRDNASERRSTDTLSGGETFLASLALALELSDQVQRTVGAVRLDCLFIDEGFGTLDPETLKVVADSIRGLQVGNRMVGVITHVPDLKDEFDQRIMVVKEAGAATVRVEID